MWRKFAKAVRELQRTYGEAFASYRPDLHYMRGPGPKWHAKHGGLAAAGTPGAAGTLPAMHKVGGAHA